MTNVLVGGASLRTPMSWQDFCALGEVKHHEHYDGMCVVNPPTIRQAAAADELARRLHAVCPPTHRVVTGAGWQTERPELFVPDVMVFERSSPDSDVLRSPPPLLVVEILSPSTRGEGRGSKREAYGRAGAGWYWIVDLGTPELLVLRNEGGLMVSDSALRSAGTTSGPLAVQLDPASLGA